MKAISPALSSFLAQGLPFIGCDLYVITLSPAVRSGGQLVKLYLTSLDRNVTYTGIIASNPDIGMNTYYSMGQSGSGYPIIERSKVATQVGLSPSQVEIDLFASPSVTLLGVPLLTTIAQGYWTNAQVWIRRAWITIIPWQFGLPTYGPDFIQNDWNTLITTNLGGAGDGTLIWYSGYIGKILELGPLNAKFEVRDPLWLLNRPLPKNLWSPGCYHTLFDTGCTLSQSAWSSGGACLAGCTTTAVLVAQTQDQFQPTAPVYSSNPISANIPTNYTLNAVTYYFVATYVTALGESVASAEWNNSATGGTPPNNYITINSPGPSSVFGVNFWNAYVGTESGDEQLQQLAIPIGTPWTENPDIGLVLTGVMPSLFATNGYWSLGVIQVTYNSGTYSGQTFTSAIETSIWNGTSTTLNLRKPLPQAPLTTDSYVIFPGCDKRKTTCGANPSVGGGSPAFNPLGGAKFGNLLNHAGQTFIPSPETGA